jgi:TonB family protein
VVLYQLLTGRCPIRGDAFKELAAGHLFHPPVPFEESDPDGRVPQKLRGVILLALEKDPAARPTVKELMLALDEHREPGRVTDDEFREIFVRAFSGKPRHEPPGEEGTTQGRVDREFGIDRTTASGTSVDPTESDVAAAVEEPDVERFAVAVPEVEAAPEQIAESPASEPPPAKPRERAPARLSTPEFATLPIQEREPAAAPARSAAVEEPGEQAAAAPAAIEAGDPPPAEPPVESVEPPRRSTLRDHWAMLIVVGLFALAAVGGYLWFRQAPSEPGRPAAIDSVPRAEAAVGPAATEPLTPGAGVTPPQVLVARSAEYPPTARRHGLAATVVLAVLVDATGTVTDVRVVESDDVGHGFDEAASTAARGTTYRPAVRDGEPGPMWTQLRFEFEP